MRTPQNLWILCISSCVEYVVSTSNRPIRRAVNRVADHDAFAVDERDAKVRATFCSRLLCCWTNDDVTAHGECRPTTPKDTSSLGQWHEVKAQAWTHISFVREHKHDAKRFAAFSHHIFFKPFLHLRRRQKDSTSRSKDARGTNDILGEGGNASVSVSATAVQSVSSSGLPRAYLSHAALAPRRRRASHQRGQRHPCLPSPSKSCCNSFRDAFLFSIVTSAGSPVSTSCVFFFSRHFLLRFFPYHRTLNPTMAAQWTTTTLPTPSRRRIRP